MRPLDKRRIFKKLQNKLFCIRLIEEFNLANIHVINEFLQKYDKSGIGKVKIVKNMQFNSCFVVYVIDYNA